jgi:hypothetical protein
MSFFLKEAAWTPSSGLTENIRSVVGPKISSTLPIFVLFSRYTNPLKYGTGSNEKSVEVSGSFGVARNKKRKSLPFSFTLL